MTDTQRNTRETKQWLREHDSTATLGYNPDGRCLQIAREGRNIGPRYPSAFVAAAATPEEFRVLKPKNFEVGMVAFSDDPADSNPYGHVYTLVGKAKGTDGESLDDWLCRTNSVVSGRTVIVRVSYFQQHWGDEFQFAAKWLNGVELDLPGREEPKPPRLHGWSKEKVEEIIHELSRLIAVQKSKKDPSQRLIKALQRDRQHMKNILERFGKDR